MTTVLVQGEVTATEVYAALASYFPEKSLRLEKTGSNNKSREDKVLDDELVVSDIDVAVTIETLTRRLECKDQEFAALEVTTSKQLYDELIPAAELKLTLSRGLFEFNDYGNPIGAPVDYNVAKRPNPAVILNGEHCVCEPLNVEKHSLELFEAFSQDKTDQLWTYLPQGPFPDAASFECWMRSAITKNDPFFYAIVDSQTCKAVGLCSYLRIDPESGSIEVGFLTFSALMKRSIISTEAMYIMMKHAFALGYRRYEWKCNALNANSINAAQRLGFSFEGLFRQARVVKGRNRDTAWFSIIDSEFHSQISSAFEIYLNPTNFDADRKQIVSLSSLTDHILRSKWPCLSVS